MADLAGHGLAVTLPAGWEGRIRRDGDQPAVLHASNFPLPAEMGDYGGGAVELMAAAHILVVVLGFGAASAGTPMFATVGAPHFGADDFAERGLHRALPGQSGAQRFFSLGGQPLGLYVVLGSHLRRVRTVPVVNSVLSTLRSTE